MLSNRKHVLIIRQVNYYKASFYHDTEEDHCMCSSNFREIWRHEEVWPNVVQSEHGNMSSIID